LHVENGVIVSVPQREKLWRAQTPQSFKLSTIIEAYSRALDDPEFKATDDCGVVMKYMPEVPVHIVKGDESNLKLTYKEDIEILELLLKRVNETTNC
jgi:2-C-methyl-D-erythritol 4-phosphate cytidylyltransferase